PKVHHTPPQPTPSPTINTHSLHDALPISHDKTYDGNANATVDFSAASLAGIVGLEDVGFDASGYSASFANKNVGTHTVSVSGVSLSDATRGNSSLTQPTLAATFNDKALSL